MSSSRDWRRLGRTTIEVVVLATLGLLVFIAYGMVGNRWYTVVAVQGGSMEPTISRGDLIVVVPPPATIEPGMILTMRVDGRVITHRVVEVNSDGSLVTRGDANNANDRWRGRVTVLGQYQFTIPAIGRFLPVRNASEASFAFEATVRQSVRIGTWASPTPTPTPTVTPSPTPSATPTATPTPSVSPPPLPRECAGMTFAEILVGTAGDDVIIAGNGGALVFGLGGNDTLRGGNGKDCLVGGDGDDIAVGGNGRDVLLGGAGNDALHGESDDDVVAGGNGRDLIDGGAGSDACFGTAKDRFDGCEGDAAASAATPVP